MKIAADRLPDALTKTLASLYVLIGDEPLGLLEAADAIRAAARAAGHTERSVHTFMGRANWQPIFASGENFSLFGEKRLAEIRVPSGKPGIDGAKAFEAYAARLPGDTVTLIELPGLEAKSTQSKWFGALERAGVVVESRPVERAQLPDWLARRLARLGLNAERAALEFIADSVEGNLLAARQEIDKLALILGSASGRHETITLAEVEAAVVDVSRLEAEALPDAWLAGDLARYAQILADLKSAGEAIPAFQWQMTATANVVFRLKSALAQGESASNFARGLWGRDKSRLPLIERAVARLSSATIAAAVTTLAALDRQAKGLDRHTDPWDTLLQLGLAWAAPEKHHGR